MFDLTQPDQFKKQVQTSFNKTNPGYGTPGDFHWEFAQRLVERAPLEAGQTIIDIATGTGPAAILAAPLVKHIFGLDLSPGILALGRRNVATIGLANIHFLCGDAETLPFPDSSINGLLCSSAIVWLPQVQITLQEWHRVLHLGGWIAFSCFGGLARQTITELLSRLLKPYGQRLPELNGPFNSPEKCRNLLHTARFGSIQIQLAQEQQFPLEAEKNFNQFWAGAQSRFNLTLSENQLAQIKAQYITDFETLVLDQANWNYDYEQFVVAYK